MTPVSAKLCLLVVAVLTVADGYKNYANYEVLRIHPNSSEAIYVINSLKENRSSDGIQFWTKPTRVGENVDVLVSPGVKSDIEFVLTTSNISYETLIGDLKPAIDNDMKSINRPSYRANLKKEGSKSFDLFSYKSHAEMNEYIDTLAKENPSFITVFSIGNSFEGRSMKVIKLTSSNNTDKGVDKLLKTYDIYIIPCINPDGYEYSRKNDRLWRTTRSFQVCEWSSDPKSDDCKCGADMNRNFEFHFGELGAGKEPCKAAYPGPKAFSEVETVNVAKWFKSHMNTIHLYISLHAYGNFIFYPYAYVDNKCHSNCVHSKSIAYQTAEAMKKATGVSYTFGTAPELLYPASGSSLDWVTAVAKVPYAFVFELTGSTFILPERHIKPTGEECFVGFKEMANSVLKKL